MNENKSKQELPRYLAIPAAALIVLVALYWNLGDEPNSVGEEVGTMATPLLQELSSDSELIEQYSIMGLAHSPEVLDIQNKCREYMAEPSADLCLKLIEVGDKKVWVGVLDDEYAQAGATVSLWGQPENGDEVLLFETAVEVGRDGVLALSSESTDVEALTLQAQIIDVLGREYLLPVSQFVNDKNGNASFFLFTEPRDSRQYRRFPWPARDEIVNV